MQGFTLLEVLIAMAIMMIAFTAILGVQSASINATRKAKILNIVAMLAKNQMIKTELDLEGKTFDEMKKEDGGQFAEPYQDYAWKEVIKEVTFPNLNFAGGGGGDSGGSGGGGGGDNADEMTTKVTRLLTKYLSDSLREVTITITWKVGSGEQHFDLSTYWVNLNGEFKFSE